MAFDLRWIGLDVSKRDSNRILTFIFTTLFIVLLPDLNSLFFGKEFNVYNKPVYLGVELIICMILIKIRLIIHSNRNKNELIESDNQV